MKLTIKIFCASAALVMITMFAAPIAAQDRAADVPPTRPASPIPRARSINAPPALGNALAPQLPGRIARWDQLSQSAWRQFPQLQFAQQKRNEIAS